VPVGSGDWLRVRLEAASEAPGRWTGEIVANPEFLREGSAVSDFLHPDRIVIGGTDEGCDVVERAFAPILSQSFIGGRFPAPRLFRMDRVSAEMVKYAANAALATKISFANEIAGLCELTGADARSVLPAVGADPRIGERNLEPGLGWGGSCFPKDTAALTAMAAEYGVRAHLLEAACAVNDGQVHSVLTKLRSTLRTLKGRTIALWGLTFKPGTDDLRSSPSLTLARELQRLGASVVASDPAVKSLPEPDDDAITVVLDPLEAVEGADALVVATAWSSFACVPPGDVAARMRGHLVIDARNLLRPTAVEGAGLRHIGVGWVTEP
jgi:nucleotide sugar dehydrogenase